MRKTACTPNQCHAQFSSQVAEWGGETACTLAAVVLIIADSSPSQPYAKSSCTPPDKAVDTLCFTAGGAAVLTKQWTRTGTHTL